MDEPLADIQLRLDAVKKPLSGLDDNIPKAEYRLKTIGDHLAVLEDSIRNLQIKKVPLEPLDGPPPPSKNEDQLTEAEWKQIQQGLVTRGFSLGRIDGNPGKPSSKTRKAIRDFQTKSGAQSTGRLTPDQINVLLGVQSSVQQSKP
jgi:peptidoglycan hydrolase-like protein with peptidoglycan-binding domain